MKAGKVVGIVFGVAIVLVGGVYLGNTLRHQNVFIQGTYINGIDVGNMTVEAAQESLAKTAEDYSLTLTFKDGETETLSADQLGYSYTPGTEVQQLLEEQNPFLWPQFLWNKKEEYSADMTFDYSKEKVKEALDELPELSEKNVIAPTNAYMQLGEDNHFSIVPETDGNQIIEKALRKAVQKAISQNETELDVTQVDGAYEQAEIRSDNEELNAQVNDLNTYMDLKETYTLTDGSTVTLDGSRIKDWLSVSEDDPNYYYVNADVIKQNAVAFIAELASQDDKTYDTLDFESTNLGTVTMSVNGGYGHSLDQSTMTDALYNAVVNRDSGEMELSYSSNSMLDSKLNGTYIEVDIPNQTVYYYQDNTLQLSASVVTGLETEEDRKTPSGIYQIYDKETNRDLKGRLNEEGVPSYVSHVSYWMPFYGGYGLHDASWRSSFGGTIYQYSGSHGCVNMDYNDAQALYNSISVGTYVVVVRG